MIIIMVHIHSRAFLCTSYVTPNILSQTYIFLFWIDRIIWCDFHVRLLDALDTVDSTVWHGMAKDKIVGHQYHHPIKKYGNLCSSHPSLLTHKFYQFKTKHHLCLHDQNIIITSPSPTLSNNSHPKSSLIILTQQNCLIRISFWNICKPYYIVISTFNFGYDQSTFPNVDASDLQMHMHVYLFALLLLIINFCSISHYWMTLNLQPCR